MLLFELVSYTVVGYNWCQTWFHSQCLSHHCALYIWKVNNIVDSLDWISLLFYVYSTHKILGISTVARPDHVIAQTRELECTKVVILQVIARGIMDWPIDYKKHACVKCPCTVYKIHNIVPFMFMCIVHKTCINTRTYCIYFTCICIKYMYVHLLNMYFDTCTCKLHTICTCSKYEEVQFIHNVVPL